MTCLLGSGAAPQQVSVLLETHSLDLQHSDDVVLKHVAIFLYRTLTTSQVDLVKIVKGWAVHNVQSL